MGVSCGFGPRGLRGLMMNGLAGLLKGARLSDGGVLRFWAERIVRFDDEWACRFAQEREVRRWIGLRFWQGVRLSFGCLQGMCKACLENNIALCVQRRNIIG
ncbi:hypothetical protein [Bartonella sp. B1098]|uniref:hypothetical protein n=1 Tax=Bartonella sp. B1098 TaxID=2911421 RepID=UPI0020C23370|nr:hypothetical protein [Bartonella sp. B1098]